LKVRLKPDTTTVTLVVEKCWRRREIRDQGTQAGRVDVILTRFIDDPNVALSASLAIRQTLIDLSDLEVLHSPIFHAQRERIAHADLVLEAP